MCQSLRWAGRVSGMRRGCLLIFDGESSRWLGRGVTAWGLRVGVGDAIIQRSQAGQEQVSKPPARGGLIPMASGQAIPVKSSAGNPQGGTLRGPSPGKWRGSRRGRPEPARGAGRRPAHNGSGSPPSGPGRPRASCASSAGCRGGLGRAP